MADRDLNLNLKVGTKEAQASLKAAAKEAKKLGDDLEDSESAGKKAAKALSKVADDLASDLKKADKAADALEKAMGVEVTNSFKKAGKSSIDLVNDLKKLGLTYDDIETDADDLAQALKKLNAVGNDIDTHVTKHMEGVSRETGKATDVMHSFAGNAVSELPMVADSFGPLSEATSQMVEGLLAGEVGFKDLVSAAAPMAGVAVAVMVVTQALERMNAKDQFDTQRLEEFEKLVKQSGDAVTNLANHYRELGKIEQTTWADNARFWADSTKDMTTTLSQAGLNIDRVSDLVVKGGDSIKEWGDAAKEAGVDAKLVDNAMMALIKEAKAYKTATDNAAKSAAFFAVTQEDVNNTLDDLQLHQDPISRFPQTFERMADALRNGVAPSYFDVDRIAKELNITTAEAIQLAMDYVTQTELEAQAQKEHARQLENAKIEAGLLSNHLRDLKGSLENLLGTLNTDDMYQNLMLGLDDLQGELDDIQQQYRDGGLTAEQAMRKSALAINGNKERVIAYAKELGNVPSNLTTEVLALIDQGKYDEAQALIDKMTDPKTLKIYVQMAKDYSTAGIPSTYKPGAKNATGTASFAGGTTLVGEAGPELVNLPAGSEILTAPRTNAALNSRSGGTYIDNRKTYISLPPQTPDTLFYELERRARRNGT